MPTKQRAKQASRQSGSSDEALKQGSGAREARTEQNPRAARAEPNNRGKARARAKTALDNQKARTKQGGPGRAGTNTGVKRVNKKRSVTRARGAKARAG